MSLGEYSDDLNFGRPPAAYIKFIFINFKNIMTQEVACLIIFLVLQVAELPLKTLKKPMSEQSVSVLFQVLRS
jgi:hypothetical protein